MQNAGINSVKLTVGDHTVTVVGNHFVDAREHLSFDPAEVELNEQVYYPALKAIFR